jgi:coenzyme F420 hydrogenase subunit beta
VTLAPSLARVARGRLCAGCGACAALAPGKVAMAEDARGWLRPVQRAPLDAAEDAAIAAVCPGLGLTRPAGAARTDAFWGPVASARVGWATDPALRRRASSGGALSAILTHLLATGAVARVVQTGADPARPIANAPAVSATAAAVAEAAGSRYAPSAPLAGARRLADPAAPAAVVGKPCDAAALRGLTRREPSLAQAFPVVLSFFCAGVPSLAGAREVLSAMGAPEAEVTAFRYRGEGWPGHAAARLTDGTERRMSYADSWGSILSRHVQFRCKICPDGVGEAADIVCADAWECDERGYPRFEEAEGVSLILARTPLGERIVAEALAAGALAAEPFDMGRLAAMQPGQTRRKRALAARLAALAAMGRPRPRYRGFGLGAAARGAGLATLAREFLGLCRRTVAGRLD